MQANLGARITTPNRMPPSTRQGDVDVLYMALVAVKKYIEQVVNVPSGSIVAIRYAEVVVPRIKKEVLP